MFPNSESKWPYPMEPCNSSREQGGESTGNVAVRAELRVKAMDLHDRRGTEGCSDCDS